MIEKDFETIKKLLLDTPFQSLNWSPSGPEDFGSRDSVRCQLKRREPLPGSIEEPQNFGTYLGKHDDEWFVGIKDIHGSLVAYERYYTLEELKGNWWLD